MPCALCMVCPESPTPGVQGLEAVLRVLQAWRVSPFLPRDQGTGTGAGGRPAGKCFQVSVAFRLSLVTPANHKATLRTKGTLTIREVSSAFSLGEGPCPGGLGGDVQSATASSPFSAVLSLPFFWKEHGNLLQEATPPAPWVPV